ncbi:MAG: Ig-like domain-containing protein, partial [Thermoplasmata archaeon]|nr:Ig-like domain-containing protein [Thermoplasmata archaeon]
IKITVRDIAGNLNTTVISFEVVPPDTTPPRLISSTPKNGDEEVPLNINITLTFSEPVQLGRVRLIKLPEEVSVEVSASITGNNITITPTRPLEKGRLYSLIVEDVKDLSGNTASRIVINFTTIYPESDDYDSDGLPNTYEERYDFLDPFNPSDASQDPDGDGLTNLEEYLNRTRPDLSDTDGDGYSDKVEVEKGTDPNDKNSYPYTAKEKKTPALYIGAGVLILLLLVLILFTFIKSRRESPALEEEAAEVGATETIEGSLEDDFVNCPECGAPVEKGAEYCPECGAILTWE